MRDMKAALLKLVEECAEVQQAAIKIMDFGPDSSWKDSPTNRTQFVQELGDLLAVASVVREQTALCITDCEINTAIENKMKKLEIYLPHLEN